MRKARVLAARELANAVALKLCVAQKMSKLSEFRTVLSLHQQSLQSQHGATQMAVRRHESAARPRSGSIPSFVFGLSTTDPVMPADRPNSKRGVRVGLLGHTAFAAREAA